MCQNVKRWRADDQLKRWIGSGLLFAAQMF